MVKKLFKHEFAALLRTLIPVEAVVLGVGILARLVLLFEQDSVAFDIVYGMTVFALIVALIAGPVAAFILAIIRFYKNMYTGEGYLSFTLPVTPSQHILVKLVTAVTLQLGAVLVSVVTFCIAFAGDVLTEVAKAGSYLIAQAVENLDPLHLGLYVFAYIVLLLLAGFGSFLIYYTCISLGQTAKKNRVLCAVGIYFAYYMINQVFSTVLMVLFSILSTTDLFANIGQWIINHPYASVHIGLWSMILWMGLLNTVFFVINRFVMRKKLNLE